jgi:hypothetical protein
MAGDDNQQPAPANLQPDPAAVALAAAAAAAAAAGGQQGAGDAAAAAAVTAAITAAAADGALVNAMKSQNYPTFWSQDPEGWFDFIEQIFRIDRVTSQSTMFGHAIRKMPFEACRDLKDIIRNIPQVDPYNHLRTETIKRLAPNNEQRLRQLLSVEEIGDTTPSNFLRRLRSLAGESITDTALRTIWMDRLPSTYPTILSAIPGQTLDQLGTIADSIHTTVAGQRPVVSATTAPPDTSAELLSAVRALTARVSALESKLDDRQARPKFRNSRSRTPAKRSFSARPLEKSGICYYHTKFGSKAERCTDGCKMSENK